MVQTMNKTEDQRLKLLRTRFNLQLKIGPDGLQELDDMIARGAPLSEVQKVLGVSQPRAARVAAVLVGKPYSQHLRELGISRQGV